METSGALMIAGSWGSGKTFCIDHTLKDTLEKDGKFPVKISLFGLSSLNGFGKHITEQFLQAYGLDSRLRNIQGKEE